MTESTKKVARCFYALAQSRADSKRYPAVDPIESYSKYLEYPEFTEYVGRKISDNWIELVNQSKTILQRGKEVYEQINILGDDGVPVDYHVTFWKSEIIDFVILQQDAFDKIDQSTPIERQQYMLEHILDICHSDFSFDSFSEVDSYFKRIINLYKQMNYSEFKSEKFNKFEKELKEILEERLVA